MAKKTKGDDAPDLHRLKAEFPEIHAALAAGKIPSLRQALVLAGLKPERSRLEKLKNSWAKASDAERESFLAWLKPKARCPRPPPPRPMPARSPPKLRSPTAATCFPRQSPRSER
jgi:hypothetical protein